MSDRKPDAKKIITKLDELKQVDWLGPARRYWPEFIFHFTDIRNIVSILKRGELVARGFLSEGESLDIASKQVIDRTDIDRKDFVRLYFRPRTPTQYHNEGIRPASRLTHLGAHCPVPVFLVFDAEELLTRRNTQFSEGNLAAGSSIGESGEYFNQIPFRSVYHDSWLNDHERSSIVFHRHAEVLYPQRLDLVPLKAIVLRSEAELETLRNLLPEDISNKYSKLMKLGIKRNLFFRQWTFVETVDLEQDNLQIHFSQSSKTPEPFFAELTISDLESSKKYSWSQAEFRALGKKGFNMPQFAGCEKSYRAELTLDDHIAYCGVFTPSSEFVS